jgi:1,4-alpha-glucan branching enzyme
MSSEEPAVASYAHFTAHVLPRIAAGGYNAVQLMGVAEHTYYGSFGYQVTSPFAVASRSGSPDDFRALVDAAHGAGLRVLLDVVHSHASASVVDGLAGTEVDGAPASASLLAGAHPEWGSRLYAYDRWETLRYLLANVAAWVTDFRVDGFRFDGVTSMLYRHHGVGVGFSGDYGEYFSPAADVDAAVYLALANLLIKRLRADAVSFAEDVSGAPGVARAVADGGLGFDARLAMGLPDLWARLGGAPDDEWAPQTIVAALCNRRRDEACVAYVESHDQCLVGDTTLSWRLMGGGGEMYGGMSALAPPSPVIARGVALHKLARAATLALGGDAYLTFMGNEFGHPEWVDFPRDGNGWSHDRARRQWSVDAPHTRYHHLGAWDRTLMALDEAYGMLASDHLLVSHTGRGRAGGGDGGDRAFVAERGAVVWVVNLSPHDTLLDFKIGVPAGGDWVVAADSDAVAHGGGGVLRPGAVFRAAPEGTPGDAASNFNDRPFSIRVTAPPRSAVAYVQKQ